MKRFKTKLEELKKLNLPRDDYAVFGSGPLAVRGIRDSSDLDIIVKQDLWKELIKTYSIDRKDLIKIRDIEIYRKWTEGFYSVDKLIDEAELIDGIRYVKLEYVLEWKKQSGRKKDIMDIELIYKYLKKSLNNKE